MGAVLAIAIETLTIIGKDGSVAAIPFPSHQRCLEAVCLISEHKTCAQVTATQEAEFTRATDQWQAETKIWADWRKKYPCVDHITGAVGGSNGWSAYTAGGKICPTPQTITIFWGPPSSTPPKHDDIVKPLAIPNVTSAECVK